MGCPRVGRGSTKRGVGGAGGQDTVGNTAEHVERAGGAWLCQGYCGVSARGCTCCTPNRHGTTIDDANSARAYSGRSTLDWLLTEKRVGAYVGVDPTAPSLHVGHLLPLMALYWMYLHGYYTVSLVSRPRPSAATAG
jgi:hypothetical protein